MEGIVELLKVGPLDVGYIARRLGASRGCVEEALRELEEGGVVERVGERWRLALPN